MPGARARTEPVGIPPSVGMRRYPVVGGVAAWRVPVLAGLFALAALALDVRAVAVSVALLGWMAGGLWRSVVIEVSPDGLARGVVLRGAFVGRTTGMSWGAVVGVHTDWCRAGDDTALETIVRAHDGATIRLSTAMGLASYWACLADVGRRVPGTTLSGLTERLLADGPPARRDLLAGAATAGALALVLMALVGIFYVWAQGRSTLSRYLEESGGSPAGPASAECGDPSRGARMAPGPSPGSGCG